MRPKTCEKCLWSGHERCPYSHGTYFRVGPVPDDCPEALLRIAYTDVRRAILSKAGRDKLRAQAANNGIFHPAIVLALLDRIDELESEIDELELEVGMLANDLLEEGER